MLNNIKLVLERLIIYYYSIPENECGGNCHLVLDDDNIEDTHLEYCYNICKEKNDIIGLTILDLLRYFNEKNRQSIIDAAWSKMKNED